MIIEVALSLTNFDRLSRRINTGASSGTAQLRETSSQYTDNLDAMDHGNLYNTIISAGCGVSPSPSLSKEEEPTGIIIHHDLDHDVDLYSYSLD